MHSYAQGNKKPGLPETRSNLARRVTGPVIRLLARTSLTPSAVSWIGFVITCGAAALVVFQQFIAAGLVMLFAGFFDMLDGALARYTNRTTRFGAVLDSVLDRFSEAVLLLAIIAVSVIRQDSALVLLTGATLFLSQAVSYIRARAEAIGVECKEGVFTRPERVVTLTAGLLLQGFSYALFTAIAIIAILSLVTVIQRLIYVRRQLGTPSAPKK